MAQLTTGVVSTLGQSLSAGTGLQAQYYNGTNFDKLALTETDPTVNAQWGKGSPSPAVSTDNFSARWTGTVKPNYSETYTFYTNADDGVRLWVNGQQLINNWTDHAATENKGTIALAAGQAYDIKMEYYEHTGDAVAQLSWSSQSQAKQIIPQSQLFLPSTTSVTTAPPTSTATTSLSSLAWTSATNGWGPVEKDKSNGEQSAGDGQAITLNGLKYATGLGVHANSEINYNLGGKYTKFASDVGIDGETGGRGSVDFQVWADGSKLYDSGLVIGNTATKSVNVDVTGKQTLKLVVTNGGDNNNYDHADWANARLLSDSTTLTSTPTPTPIPTPTPTPTPVSATRDKWLQPFASNSIWNMPVGSNAAYVPAGLQDASFTGTDVNLLYNVPAGSPERPIYDPASWEHRASGTAVADPNRRKTIPIPDDLLVADAAPPNTPNNASAFLLPDGKTVVQISPLTRTQNGGPVYGWVSQDINIYGDGITGGHAGSGLSSIGGTIRKGELTGSAPIKHALQLEVWAQQYLSYNNDGTSGYRWPANRADSYAASTYHGKNPALEMGALLALSPSATVDSLGLKTEIGKKLFHALQDYGGYVVDDTAWNADTIGIEYGVDEEVKAAYGYTLDQYSGAIHDDFNKLFTALNVVNNNSATNIGGGGTPRQPLDPPISN